MLIQIKRKIQQILNKIFNTPIISASAFLRWFLIIFFIAFFLFFLNVIINPEQPEQNNYQSSYQTENLTLNKFYTKSVSNVRKCPSLSCEIIGQYAINSDFDLPYNSIDKLPEWIEFSWEGEQGNNMVGYINKTVLSPNLTKIKINELKQLNQNTTPPTNSILCNDIYWSPCQIGQQFYCPESGDAECILENNQLVEESKQYYLEPRAISLRSIVGIQCNFENDKGDKFLYRGSGVFIHPDGYILTVRHLIDPEWTKWAYDDQDIDINYNRFIDCYVRFLHSERKIFPTDQSPYGFFDLHKTFMGQQYDFKAEITYLPDNSGLSEYENKQLDYTILKITEKNTTKYFSNEKPKIYYSPILMANVEQWMSQIKGQKVLIPGYAYQAIGAAAFEQYRLLTKDATVLNIFKGDKAFEENPFIIETKMYPDAFGGRSGSPIFYKGYIIGVFQGKYIPEPNTSSFIKGSQTTISAITNNLSNRLNGEMFKIFGDYNYFKE